MVIMDEIASIKSFFQSHNVDLSSAWLEGCVSWCKEENLPPNYTLKDLQHKVFEQWLLLDLRDVEVPCLPPDLSSKTKYILNGNYSLQVMKVVDISKPKHWQLQRIRNNTYKNVESENESSKRVLQLTLTDGVQEVEAMEYQPISCLNLNLSPGIKIRLMGPITVRKGRLMLENKNVKILGGEVEDLLVPNAAENVLATFLKLPLNPKPNVIEESLLTANSEMFENIGGNATAPQNQNNVRNAVINTSNTGNRSLRQTTPSIVSRNNSNSSARQNDDHMIDLNEEEELRIAAQIDMLMETERDLENPAKRKKSGRTTPDLFEDPDFDDSVFGNIEIPNVTEKAPDPPKTPLSNGRIQNLNDSLEVGNEFFENFDIDAHLDEATRESKWIPNTSPKPLVFTIEKLRRNMPNISNGKFKIKVKFGLVVEKLTLNDDEYHLVVKVEDETGNLDVRIHTDVVSDFAGCCATALNNLRTGILENNSEAQEKVLQILRRIREKLVQLNHVVEVQVNSKEKFPVIINIIE